MLSSLQSGSIHSPYPKVFSRCLSHLCCVGYAIGPWALLNIFIALNTCSGSAFWYSRSPGFGSGLYLFPSPSASFRLLCKAKCLGIPHFVSLSMACYSCSLFGGHILRISLVSAFDFRVRPIDMSLCPVRLMVCNCTEHGILLNT